MNYLDLIEAELRRLGAPGVDDTTFASWVLRVILPSERRRLGETAIRWPLPKVVRIAKAIPAMSTVAALLESMNDEIERENAALDSPPIDSTLSRAQQIEGELKRLGWWLESAPEDLKYDPDGRFMAPDRYLQFVGREAAFDGIAAELSSIPKAKRLVTILGRDFELPHRDDVFIAELSAAALQPYFDAQAVSLQATAKVPGHKRGRVPLEVLKTSHAVHLRAAVESELWRLISPRVGTVCCEALISEGRPYRLFVEPYVKGDLERGLAPFVVTPL